MKKILIALMFIGWAVPSVIANEDNCQDRDASTVAADEAWKLFREKVPYCTDENTCAGYGQVWVNTETYQVAFKPSGSNSRYDLAVYTKLDGYNMRFYYNDKYYYVNLFVPQSAFQ